MSDIEFHAVAKTGDLDEGEALQVIVGRKEIAIYNLDGEFYATDDICTHAYASLADGYVYVGSVSRSAWSAAALVSFVCRHSAG